jgi:molybdopterin adenylyltransferase
VGAVIADCRF